MIFFGVAAVILAALLIGPQFIEAAPSANETTEGMIRRVAISFGRSPALMLAMCRTESSFNEKAINPSDPSYGLFQIQTFWLPYFKYPEDSVSLLQGEFNTEIACRIVGYFEKRGFSFPAQADVYNVGETLWAKGRRNIPYRDKVLRAFNEYNV